MKVWLLALVLGGLAPEPSPPDLVYYNARLALREDQPREVLKLWLLRNALESKSREVSEHDEDFNSLVWVALGDLGYCQDGLRLDRAGGGLWPLALHNWFLKNMRRGEPPEQGVPFDAFQVPQQQRFVSLQDVLSDEELRAVRFYRTSCYRMKDALVSAGLPRSADPADRDVEVKVLEFLLESARRSVSPERVRGRAIIEARLLDLRLASIERLEINTRRADRDRGRQIQDLGGAKPPPTDVARSTPMLRLLSVAADWAAEDWLTLDPERRLYLYDRYRRAGLADGADQALPLAIIDRLIADRRGRELSAWIAMMGETPQSVARVWSGARGKRLLGLGKETGFRERSAIALQRGVDAVGQGDLPAALRAFAYALHFAPESREGETIRRLGLRWLSYVAGQFEVTDELVTLLVQLVPRGDLAQILEGLIWQSALRADAASFDRTVAAHRGRGALRQRIERLQPLSRGDAGRFLTGLRDDIDESPRAVLRFTRRFLERLETQDGDVRLSHVGTLRALRELLLAHGTEAGVGGSLGRLADGLEGDCAAMLEGMASAGPATDRDAARALAPTTEVFVGSIRLAPSDPLPWPFPRPDPRAPSVFDPIEITPVEWRDGATLVMGWKLGR